MIPEHGRRGWELVEFAHDPDTGIDLLVYERPARFHDGEDVRVVLRVPGDAATMSIVDRARATFDQYGVVPVLQSRGLFYLAN